MKPSPGAIRRRVVEWSGLVLAGMVSVAVASADAPRAGSPPRALYVELQPQSVLRIEAGWFVMGSTGDDVEHAVELCQQGLPRRLCRPQAFAVETPARRVFVGAFEIDRTEVSRAAYRRCELAHACTASEVSDRDPRFGQSEQPIAYVDARQAETYCRWLGGRLPTEAEWERAARGGSARRFPWGQHYNSRVANHGTPAGEPDPIDGYTHAAPVTALPDGRSAHGLLNMGGNVWEWTADRFHPDYYREAPRVDPRGPAEGALRVIRGGSWGSPPHLLRATTRAGLAPQERRPDVGFRCAYDLPPT